MTGMFAISKAGHDKGELYIIIKEDAEYVYLVDGIRRKLLKPKKKKKKHIQIIRKVDGPLCCKINQNETVRDEDIKRAVKLYSGERI